jgi:hypothetical protein
MKFNKPIDIRVTPDYDINEPISEEEVIVSRARVNGLGGLNSETNYCDDDSGEQKMILQSGGRMDWGLHRNSHYSNPVTSIQLMRLWTCQMVTQMVNNKAYVNEISDEPKFDVTDEEREIVLNVMKKLGQGLNDCLEKSTESMVINKKIKKVEL